MEKGKDKRNKGEEMHKRQFELLICDETGQCNEKTTMEQLYKKTHEN